jgi:translation initiation factor 2B subunit (eIF-2B alpha/beta/delta family)
MVNLAQRGFSELKGVTDLRLLQAETEKLGRTSGAEILASEKAVASGFEQMVSPEERIVTIGSSSLCERALVNAQARGKHPSVTVLLASAKPETLTVGKRLAQSHLDVSYGFLADAMRHVASADRVIIGAHLISHEGDVFSAQGADMLALAANRLGKPVVVLAGPFKAVSRSTDYYSDYLRMLDLDVDFTVDKYTVGTRDLSVVPRDLVDVLLEHVTL